MIPIKEEEHNLRIGKAIREFRLNYKNPDKPKTKGMTQTELANRISVTFQQVQKYEKGTNGTSGFKIKQLAEMFKVNVLYFFEDRPDYTIVTHEEILQDKNLNLSPKHWIEKKKEEEPLVLTKEMEVK